MASLDCAVLRDAVSRDATQEIHGASLLIEPSRRGKLVFKAALKSLGGTKLPIYYSKAWKIIVHLAWSTTPRITRIIYVRTSKTTTFDSYIAFMAWYGRPVLVD